MSHSLATNLSESCGIKRALRNDVQQGLVFTLSEFPSLEANCFQRGGGTI